MFLVSLSRWSCRDAALLSSRRAGAKPTSASARAQKRELGVVIGAALEFRKALRRGKARRLRLFHHQQRARCEPLAAAQSGERLPPQLHTLPRIDEPHTQ